jgi:LacI family transcriptional regulator, galactose operon repressor
MRERLAGAHEALADAGIAAEEALVRDGVRDPASAAKATGEMLDRPDPPTAFFTLNNRLTVGALHELWRRDSDAALVGFDDFELSHLMPRPVTVVGYDLREYARTAAQLLFERIHGGQSQPRTVVLPTRLLERGITPRR